MFDFLSCCDGLEDPLGLLAGLRFAYFVLLPVDPVRLRPDPNDSARLRELAFTGRFPKDPLLKLCKIVMKNQKSNFSHQELTVFYQH